MTKRTNRNKNRPKLVSKDDDNVVEDRISNLGDDILVSIISRLTTREAIATSVLSSRWQPLHTRLSRLNLFPEVIQPRDFEKEKESLNREKFRKHMKRVNRTLDSYEGGHMLNELRIHSYLFEGADLKRWLEFGLCRQVQILDIRMMWAGTDRSGTYSLQLENLLMETSTSSLKSLRELCLSNVGVNDLEIKVLVSNSPNLETLSIECTKTLRHVSIVGHPKLQHLNLSVVRYVESIEIENVLNLVSLKCFSLMQLPSKYVVRLSNLPKLIEVNTNDFSRHFLFKLPSWVCSQLMVFRVSTNGGCLCEYPRFPPLINVKHLKLKLDNNWYGCNSGPAWVDVLESFKFLETLHIKRVWHPYDKVKLGVSGGAYEKSELYKMSPKLHKVRLSGYVGWPEELLYTVFIIQRSAGLKELILEPCRASKLIRQVVIGNLWKQLGPIIPNSLNFVVV